MGAPPAKPNSSDANFIEVPVERLSAETLSALAQEFVTREGTDYGHADLAFETKVQQVIKQLKSGEAVLVFDLERKTHTLLGRQEFKHRLSQNPRSGTE